MYVFISERVTCVSMLHVFSARVCVCIYVCVDCVCGAKRRTEKRVQGTRTQKAVLSSGAPSRGSPFTRDLFVRLQLLKICTILIKHHSFFVCLYFNHSMILSWCGGLCRGDAPQNSRDTSALSSLTELLDSSYSFSFVDYFLVTDLNCFITNWVRSRQRKTKDPY